jgi:hypothetical protein
MKYSEYYGVRVISCCCKKLGISKTENWWYHTMNRQAVVHGNF